jgi:hypothetical protein
MNPSKHSSNNVTAAPPANWDDRGGKLRLPVLHVTKGDVSGVPVFVSFWKPTTDELSILLSGGMVQLSCVGGQPACNVSAVPEESGPAILLPN